VGEEHNLKYKITVCTAESFQVLADRRPGVPPHRGEWTQGHVAPMSGCVRRKGPPCHCGNGGLQTPNVLFVSVCAYTWIRKHTGEVYFAGLHVGTHFSPLTSANQRTRATFTSVLLGF